MKKTSIIATVLLLAVFFLFAAGSGEDATDAGSNEVQQPKETAAPAETEPEGTLGDYIIVIDSCRLAKTYDDKPVVIVKYIYTNVSSENPTSFSLAVEDEVYQNGVGLNRAYFVDESANYSSDNQNKDIKAGATIEVEVAYELNDTTTDIEVEVEEFISWNDDKVVKTFALPQ